MGARDCDRWSSVLGQPCRIMQPLGTPKPREECQPFTFEMYDHPRDFLQPHPRTGTSWADARRIEDAEANRKPVERLLANDGHLAVRCSRCSKKGKNCSESRSASVRHACLVRQCS